MPLLHSETDAMLADYVDSLRLRMQLHRMLGTLNWDPQSMTQAVVALATSQRALSTALAQWGERMDASDPWDQDAVRAACYDLCLATVTVASRA